MGSSLSLDRSTITSSSRGGRDWDFWVNLGGLGVASWSEQRSITSGGKGLRFFLAALKLGLTDGEFGSSSDVSSIGAEAGHMVKDGLAAVQVRMYLWPCHWLYTDEKENEYVEN